MFDNNVSYLYSDDFLALSSSNKKELATKHFPSFECQSIRPHIRQSSNSKLDSGHRTKHIILFRDEAIIRDKQRKKKQLALIQLKEKQQSFEGSFYNRIQHRINEQAHLESHVTMVRLCKTDFKTKINNNISKSHQTNLFLTDEEKPPILLGECHHHVNIPYLTMAKILNFNPEIDDKIDSS